MLRRDLREIYRSSALSQEQKDRVMDILLEKRPKGTEMKGRKWKPRGQTGAWCLIILALLLVLGAAGYGLHRYGAFEYVADLFAEGPTVPVQSLPESTEPSSTQTEPTQTEPRQLDYQPLIAKYVQSIEEDWDMERCEKEDISYMVMFLESPGELSCSITDLDANGIQELIITDGSVIYDLFTCEDGEYRHILSGAERNSYTLTADNMIVNVMSSGASSTVYSFSLYYGGHLIPVELIVCDAEADPSAPWFRGIDDPEDVEPITEQEARDIIAMYPSAQIACGPITAYD